MRATSVILWVGLVLGATVQASPFLEKYPELKSFVFVEPRTHFLFGFGVSPVSVHENRISFSGNIFQVHWIKEPFDLELFSASVGVSTGRNEYSGLRHFTFRMAPKLNIFQHLSVGPIGGYEFVSFPDVQVRLMKAGLFTPVEPFSSRGWIYGVMASQVFELGEGYLLRINESMYKQTYSTRMTSYDWEYVYIDPDIQNDSEHRTVKPSLVFSLEVSLLY